MADKVEMSALKVHRCSKDFESVGCSGSANMYEVGFQVKQNRFFGWLINFKLLSLDTKPTSRLSASSSHSVCLFSLAQSIGLLHTLDNSPLFIM